MKKIFTLSTLLAFGTLTANAQCVEAPKNRVLLVGDSWASFMNADQTITNGLKILGHSDKKFTSSVVIAENGAQTDDFLTQTKQDAIQALIDANPSIDMIHLSIGGNDVMGDWNINYTQHQTDSMQASVATRLEEVIEFLKSTRPGIRVFWAGYAYPNFEEVITTSGVGSLHPFYGTWDGMGQPTFIQINSLLNAFSDSVAAYTDADPLVDFVRAQAILQYTYGQSTPLGVAPGGTYPAFSQPLPLGDPSYPSPKETMRLYAGIFTDCFHLTAAAYETMFVYQGEHFYQNYFMDDMYALSEGGNMDGSVSSAGDVSSTIMLGESGGNEVAAVVSFNTQQMADTTLAGASIFLRRESITGTNPIAANDVVVTMVNGTLGTTAEVEAVDYVDTGDASGEPCKHGSFNNNAKDGHWLRLDLTAEMLANISASEHIQFMISVPGFTGGSITFNDASDPSKAPKLNLKYGEEPSSVTEIRAAKELPVYPIPTVGPLTVDVATNSVLSIDVINVLGAVVLRPIVSNNKIDISSLPNGSYILKITTKEGVSAKRIIKR
ncbi:MAG: T9SS type A sorting domain-containing protein [Flavobacteriales bacterium]|jgi:lysophospholipase L1-like esterase|nr:T9SS type A sorting domain-containing protein [Flavobacteriales bacterium]